MNCTRALWLTRTCCITGSQSTHPLVPSSTFPNVLKVLPGFSPVSLSPCCVCSNERYTIAIATACSHLGRASQSSEHRCPVHSLAPRRHLAHLAPLSYEEDARCGKVDHTHVGKSRHSATATQRLCCSHRAGVTHGINWDNSWGGGSNLRMAQRFLVPRSST